MKRMKKDKEELFSKQEVELGDICMDISYGYTASAKNIKDGIKFLRITDITGGTVDWNHVPSCNIPPEKIDKFLLQDGDIVIARTGNTGENYIYHGAVKSVFASYLIRFRPNKKMVEPDYLWFCMRSNKWWNFIDSVKVGSVQAGANAKVLSKFVVSLPPINKQRQVATILKAFNDKIEINAHINKTLEAMAEAIFKSWFVDFDPVMAKMAERKRGGSDEEVLTAAMMSISGKSRQALSEFKKQDKVNYANLRETALLFPETLEATPLGLIPLGWRILNLGNICHIKQGRYQKLISDERATEYRFPVWGGNGVRGFVTEAEYAQGTTLLTCRGASCGLIQRTREMSSITNSVMGLIPKSKTLNQSFLHNLILTIDFFPFITGSAQPQITVTNLEKLEVCIASVEIQEAFSKVVSLMQEFTWNNEIESETVAAQRDFLLPKLLSGSVLANEM